MSESAFSAALLAELDALIETRIAAAVESMKKSKPGPGRLLTLPEAAERLRRSTSWLYHHHKRLRLGGKTEADSCFPRQRSSATCAPSNAAVS